MIRMILAVKIFQELGDEVGNDDSRYAHAESMKRMKQMVWDFPASNA